MLNAAPGLYASVKRTTSPTTEKGTCGSRCCTAKYLVITSRMITRTAAVQNTRPFLEVELMSCASLRELPRFDRHGRRRGHRHALGFGVLAPQHPGEQERPEAHRHVGDVEGRPPRVAEPDVDEIHDAEVRANAVDQISYRAATDERERQRPEDVPRTRCRIETSENQQRHECQ